MPLILFQTQGITPEPESTWFQRKEDEEQNQRAVMLTNNGDFYPILIKHKTYADDQLREKMYTLIEIIKR